jgi:putative endopeptidase
MSFNAATPIRTPFLVLLLALGAATLFAQGSMVQDPLVAHIDPSVKPGADFFLYANGGWFKQNPIPASEASNGIWQIIQDTVNSQVRQVCETSAQAKAASGSNKQKIGDFFWTGMDSVALNTKGLSDLKSDFDRIDAVSTPGDLAAMTAYVHEVAGSPMFGFGVGQDDRISSKYAVFVAQGGLSMPDRRYYVDPDSSAMQIRAKFVEHIARVFRLIGYEDSRAKSAASRVMALEASLATSARKREDTRDPLKNYNKMTFASLKASMPAFEWNDFVAAVGLKNVDTVIVGQPEYLAALNSQLRSVPMADWKEYLKYQLVHGLAGYLDDATYMESFNFYAKTLRGIQEPKPRWKRVVEQTNRSLGDLIGQVYVAEYLPKGTKEKLLEIGNAIRDEFAVRIKNLDWMSSATKEKALAKLAKIIMKVGYPDKWRDLSAMAVDRSSYVKNGMSANRWYSRYNTAKFGKPVDRTEWDMQPQTYNAYYNPSNNEICVPGCNIIVPGYERTMADDAILYSIIGGSTFGHEITHGFDDQGCKYNADGNLENWWQPEDSTRFVARTGMIVDQFNGYVAVDTLHVNGELTQGENIADLGGVIMGYEAFHKTKQYTTHQVIAGLTADQRYFLGYALAWMVNERPESIAMQVRSNEHSPAKFRVNGPLANMPEFHATFGVKPGEAMYRGAGLLVRIW